MSGTNEIRLVVFDWAGTTVDYGCFAPVSAFVRTFQRHGVEVTSAQARAPMGLHKRAHLLAMLQDVEVAENWRRTHGQDWNELNVDTLYHDFMPIQMEVLDDHSLLVPGLLDCVAELRRRGVRIGGTTGYFRAAAELVYRLAEKQGFVPECSVCVEEVPEGRPAPWMITHVMEALRVYPPSTVVKVGDTVPDIDEGLNAGVWSIGVTGSSSAVGCTEDEMARLTDDERGLKLTAARNLFFEAGAHAVIDALSELPPLLTDLGQRLRRGARP